MHSQFKRAKERIDSPDAELYAELLMVYHMSADADVDCSILQRLAEKLELVIVSDLIQESVILHEMVANDSEPGEVIDKMSMLLKRIKDFVQTHESEFVSFTSRDVRETPVIPNDFRCPISWELMGDPVIVSTGQVLKYLCCFCYLGPMIHSHL